MKRIYSILLSLILLLSVVGSANSADLQSYAFPFTGRWNPTENPLLLDDYGLQDVQNVRKYGKHFKGVDGHVVVNASSLSTYYYLLNGFHFRKDQPQESHVIVYAGDGFTPAGGRLYQNTTAIPNAGNFSATALYTPTYFNNIWRFSKAPAGNVIAANGDETLIWGGNELEATAFLTSSAAVTYTVTNANDYSDVVNNTRTGAGNVATVSATGGINAYTQSVLHLDGVDASTAIVDALGPAWTVGGHAAIDTAQYKFGTSSAIFDGNGDDYARTTNATLLAFRAGNWEIDMWVRFTALPGAATNRYFFSAVNSGPYGLAIALNNTAGTYKLGVSISSNGVAWNVAAVSLGAKTDWATGTWYHIRASYDGANYRFFVDGTEDVNVASVATINAVTNINLGYLSGANCVNGWIDEFKMQIGGTVTTANFTSPTVPFAYPSNVFLIGSKRPLQGVHLYVDTPNPTASTLTVSEWQGSGWTALAVTDNTDTGASLATSGTVTWAATNSAKTRYINGLSLYWYQFTLDAGSADIYYVTTDAPITTIRNIWSLDEEYPAKVLKYDGTTYKDYTDESVDSSQATYAGLNSLQTTHYLLVGFLEPQQGISFKFVAGSENSTAATQATAQMWNGSSWQTLTALSDGTMTTTTALSKGGVMAWSPATAGTEFKYTVSSEIPLYYYKIYFAGNLDADTKVSEIRGIPTPATLPTYKFAELFQGRTFLCNEPAGEQNKCIYSMYNAPDTFNGEDSGTLYFGDKTEVTASAVLYNVFLSAGYDQLIVTKKNETYRVYGDGPENWITQRISGRIGCVAPLSMAVAEITEISQDVKRNVAIWVTDTGVVMADGATITSISEDIKVYWDANSDLCISPSYAHRSVGWYDPKLQSYKLLIVSGSKSTYLNTELEYSLKHKEWTKIYRENATGANPLQSGFEVFDTNGLGYTYGGGKDGFMYRLEYGNNWNSVADISSYLHTKDLILDNEKPLFRLSTAKYLRTNYKSKDTGHITITHYGDRTASATGVSGQFAPSVITNASTTQYNTQSVNLGPFLYHSFKYSATTDVADGLEITGFGVYFSPQDTIR